MDKLRSIYLDFLRIIAAFYVFIYHVGSLKIGNELVFAPNDFLETIGFSYFSAHYFVLSVYLITMSASRPNVSLKGFMIARLGRLYSVLLPALVLSIIVAQILIGYNIYDSNLIQNNSNLILRFLLNISFLAESWFLNATPPLNGPFWSVHYEFMYYLIIASCLLVKGRMKYFFILFFVLIAGIK